MKRYQRQRTKGWTKPKGCVYIGRGSKYGNKFQVGKNVSDEWIGKFDALDFNQYFIRNHVVSDNKEAVRLFIKYQLLEMNEKDLHELMGKDIMCFCKESDICHGDVFIDLNNRLKIWEPKKE